MTTTIGTSKPAVLPVNLDGIPAGLRAEKRWVVWRMEKRAKNWTKIPLQVASLRKAKSNDPSTWSPMETTVFRLSRAEKDNIDGIGFMLGDGFAGVDLDRCVDPQTGAIEPWAADIIHRFGTYAEISPSGTGVKVFCRGSLPAGLTGRRKGRIEVYGKTRYFTVTGHRLPDSPARLADCTEALGQLCEQLADGGNDTAEPDDTPNAEPTAGCNGQPTDDQILAAARSASNGAAFSRLWSGDTAGYPSQSEADLALCNFLAFYAGPDPQRLDALFRQSGLFREKWDEKHFGNGQTYGQATIDNALNGRTEFYQWSKARKRKSKAPRGAPGIGPLELTDIGNARRFAEMHGRDLRYNSLWGKWLCWSGQQWVVDNSGEVIRRAKETVRQMYGEAAKMPGGDGEPLVKHALATARDARLRAMIDLARSEPGIPILPDALDTDPWLLNVENGTLRVRWRSSARPGRPGPRSNREGV